MASFESNTVFFKSEVKTDNPFVYAVEYGRNFSKINNSNYVEGLRGINKKTLNEIANGGSSETFISPFSNKNIVNIYEREIPVGMSFPNHLFYKMYNKAINRSDKVYAQRFFVPFTKTFAKNNYILKN